jgi:Flp pilus assembly protein TadD
MTDKKLTREDGVVCLVLLFITLAIYSQLGHAAFLNFDDNRYVSDNRNVQGGVTFSSVKWALTTGYADNWHPMTWISHMLDCQLFGPDPGKQHLVNVAFHAANSILLFFVLRLMTGAMWRPAFVAAMFAWHPLHVESVAWIAERKDVLSGFFMMLTLLVYALYAKKPNVARYILLLAFFVLGLMSKPMLVTLPFVLLLLDIWPLRRLNRAQLDTAKFGSDLRSPRPATQEWGEGGKAPTVAVSSSAQVNLAAPEATAGKTFRDLVMEKIPFIFLSLLCSVITYHVQSAGGTTRALDAPLGTRLIHAFISYASYTGKLLWPSNLAVFYPYDKHPAAWEILGGIVFVAGVSLLALAWLKEKPWLFTGWCWFLGTLVPVIGIVQVGDQDIADRYTYIPSVGLFILVAWGMADFAASRPILKSLLPYIAIAYSVGCVYGSWLQARWWQNSELLFRHALAVAKDNPTAEYNLGQSLQAQNKFDDAMPFYSNAIKLDPRQYLAYNNLGFCQTVRGDFASATNNYLACIGLKPDYWPPRLNLAFALQKLGDVDGAISSCAEAARLAPDQGKPHFILGTLEMAKGLYGDARQELEKAAALMPADPNAHLQLAITLGTLGETQNAVAEYQAVLRLKPDDITALNNLAWIRAANWNAEFRNGSEAVELAQKACQISGNSKAFLLGTLAAAYAEAGRFPEAVETAKLARETAHAAGQNQIADANERLIKTYQSGSAYHESPPTAR